MSKKQHASDEFGKPMSTNASAHYFDKGVHGIGAPSQILITGIDEEKSGVTPSPFTIATWKIALTLAIVFLVGAGGLYYLVRTGQDRPRGDVNTYFVP